MTDKNYSQADAEIHLEQLKQTPISFTTLTKELPAEKLENAPKGVWSAKDNLAHLDSCAEVWGYSIYAMLRFDTPVMAKFHPREWTKAVKYRNISFTELLHKFTIDRKLLLGILEKLKPEQWERTALIDRHIFSVYAQARRMALHEVGHIAQIEEFLKAS